MKKIGTQLSLVAIALCIALAGAIAPVSAAPATVKAPVIASAAMLFLGETPEALVTRVVGIRVQNITSSAIKGSLRVLPEQGSGDSHAFSPVRIPVSLAASEEATVRVPLPPVSASVYRYDVLFETDSETFPLTKFDHTQGYNQYTLVDLSQPPRLVQLRGSPLPGTSSRASYGAPMASIATVSIAAGSGDIVLPEQPSAYATVAAVFVRSDQLARTPQAAQAALLAWVHAGGTLAVSISRPEDLRLGPLPTLLGGEIVTSRVSKEVLSPSSKTYVPPVEDEGLEEEEVAPTPAVDAGTGSPKADSGAIEDSEDAAAVPIAFTPKATPAKKTVPHHVPPSPKTPAKTPVLTSPPSATIIASLVGYKAPKLRETRFGSTARVGLGQVHLLAFDPTAPGVIEESWTRTRMLELIGDATRVKVLDGPITRPWHANSVDEVRKLLDPNEGFRPALLISTMLLVVYATLLPFALFWARKRQRLFDGLLLVPFLSGATFFAIVAVSFISRGAQSRARRLSLVEVASGDEQGSIRRYRGFFSNRSSSLAIAAESPSAMLALANDDVIGGGELRKERDGLVLTGVPTAAWQTLIVREDDMFALKGGVRLKVERDGSVTIENGTAFKLVDVLVSAGGKGETYLQSIDARATASTKTGKKAGSSAFGPTDFKSYFSDAPPQRRNAVASRWQAFNVTSGGTALVTSPDRTILSAELVGADAVARDGDLRVDEVHTHIRVLSEEAP